MPIVISDIPFFQDLAASELESVKQCLRDKKFDKGESLFLEGNACERVFFVKSGRIKLYRTSSSGREQILETLGPGDTCACNPGSGTWSCASSAQAVTSCEVWFLSRENYIKLVQTNSKLSHALNRLFAERLKCFSSLIEEVSLKDSKKRLVKFLLDRLEENASDYGAIPCPERCAARGDSRPNRNALSIPFTREELAQRIGIARETAARQLYQLKRKKFIDIKPHQILIRDKEGLKKLL